MPTVGATAAAAAAVVVVTGMRGMLGGGGFVGGGLELPEGLGNGGRGGKAGVDVGGTGFEG